MPDCADYSEFENPFKPNSGKGVFWTALATVVLAFGLYLVERYTDFRIRSPLNEIGRSVSEAAIVRNGGVLHDTGDGPMPIYIPLAVMLITALGAPLILHSSRKLAREGQRLPACVTKARTALGVRVVTLRYMLNGKERSHTTDIHGQWGAGLSAGDKVEVLAAAGFFGGLHVLGPSKSAAPRLAEMMASRNGSR